MNDRGSSDGPGCLALFLVLGVIVLIVQGIGDFLGISDDEDQDDAARQERIDDQQEARKDRQAAARERRQEAAAERRRDLEAQRRAEARQERQQAAAIAEEPAPEPEPAASCEAGYDPCVPLYPPDLDCPDVSGPISVSGSDPHGFDADGDGVGCE